MHLAGGVTQCRSNGGTRRAEARDVVVCQGADQRALRHGHLHLYDGVDHVLPRLRPLLIRHPSLAPFLFVYVTYHLSKRVIVGFACA